jgi:hypothetical protein
MRSRIVELYTEDRPARLVIYALIVLAGFSYGVVKGVVLSQPLGMVTREIIYLTMILSLSLPVAYSFYRATLAKRESRVPASLAMEELIPFATKPDETFHSLEEVEIQLEHARQDLQEIQIQFDYELKRRDSYFRGEHHIPSVIDEEYHRGRSLYWGAFGSAILSGILACFYLSSTLAVNPFLAIVLGMGIAVSGVLSFRSSLTALAGASLRSPKWLSVLAPVGLGAGFALLLIAPTSAGWYRITIAAASVALALTGGAVSALADTLLWSDRLTSFYVEKRTRLEELSREYTSLKKREESPDRRLEEKSASG